MRVANRWHILILAALIAVAGLAGRVFAPVAESNPPAANQAIAAVVPGNGNCVASPAEITPPAACSPKISCDEKPRLVGKSPVYACCAPLYPVPGILCGRLCAPATPQAATPALSELQRFNI